MSTDENVANSQFPLGIDRDIENARVLIEEQPWSDNPQKYRKSAEAILKRILTVDPENKLVKALLIKAQVPVPEAVPVPAAPVFVAPIHPAPAPPPPVRTAPDEFSFVVQAAKPKEEKKVVRSPIGGLLGFAGGTVIVGAALFGLLSGRFQSQYAPKSIAAPAVMAKVSPAAVQVSDKVLPIPNQSVAEVLPEPPAASVPAVTMPAAKVQANVPVNVPVNVPTAKPVPAAGVVVKAPAAAVAPIQTGTLAISSPTTVDIYLGSQFLGSAPTTLELPIGNQQLEYRHQNVKKVMTHAIKAGETTTAMITFDVPVQINAKPWAQVFIEGSQRQPLGQTPLSDVRVPIGSVLVFENPNFPGKSYRVTGRETEIRVTFP